MIKSVLAILVLMSAPALAQEETSIAQLDTSYSSGESISHGIRFDLVKSFLNPKVSGSGSVSSNSQQSVGFALGYASIRENKIGYIADAQYDTYSDSLATARLEGDATIGFRSIGYAFAGANVSKIVSGLDGLAATPGIGFQLGLGANVEKNVGFSFGYVSTTNSVEDNSGNSGKISFSGIEVKLHATF